MESWDVQTIVRVHEEFESVMVTAIEDSTPEARNAAKRTYAAYAAKVGAWEEVKLTGYGPDAWP
jgi:hypothetical protein